MPHDDNDDSRYADLQRLEALQRALSEQSEKLAKFVPRGALTVKVDGQNVASLNLDQTSRVQFTVDDESAELIKVVSEEDQLVLGVHLLDEETWQSQNGEHFYVVRHHTGRRIVFGFRRIENAGSGNDQLLVVVAYKEPRLTRSYAFLKGRIGDLLSTLKGATSSSVAFLSPSRLHVPLITSYSKFRSVLVFLITIVALAPVIIFLLLNPVLLTRNVQTKRETNSNITLVQNKPHALGLTEVPGETTDNKPLAPVHSEKPYVKKFRKRPNSIDGNVTLTLNSPTSLANYQNPFQGSLVPNSQTGWVLNPRTGCPFK